MEKENKGKSKFWKGVLAGSLVTALAGFGIVGAPVFGADGGLVGAVSVSTLYRDAVNYEELGQVVLKKARQLSEMLGYIR